MDCAHWSPKGTDPGMARLGFARCLQRPTAGLTLSAHAPMCGQFQAASAQATKERHAKWDVKKAGTK